MRNIDFILARSERVTKHVIENIDDTRQSGTEFIHMVKPNHEVLVPYVIMMPIEEEILKDRIVRRLSIGRNAA